MSVSGGWIRPDGTLVSVAAAADRAARLAATLPPRPLLNLCGDRLDFATTLLAAAFRRQPCLLPAADTSGALAAVHASYPDAAEMREVDLEVTDGRMPGWLDRIAHDDEATVTYTSGSTGTPKPVAKTWRLLLGDATCLVAALHRHGVSAGVGIVATVPPQHMYGLETTLLTALTGPFRVHVGRPFFPADIAAALRCVDGPRMLVSTPVHLKALMNSDIELPPVENVISAAAPLAPDLAERLRDRLDCRVIEIYGSTETGAVASREPCSEAEWTLFPGIRVGLSDPPVLSSAHLPAGTVLQDRVDVLSPERFRLLGRPDDMLKVAGKRYSKQALTDALLAVDGVEDAAVATLDAEDRVAAVVVAPGLVAADVRRALARQVDPVFIPRPLRCVDTIPKTPTGKPAMGELRKLLAERQGS
ncbi:AMP-binding protein [uncultured Abyssibacter sp.]|uniref:AMP-binding protein n=1 Tax=uncultured Abyssibacter sp. TaxID=2320202 RepID=UPI0032B2E2C3